MTVSSRPFGIRNMPALSARRASERIAGPAAEIFAQYGENGRRVMAEPFSGITTAGSVVPGLFKLESTGASTEPIRQAAEAFLESLSADQRQRARFDIEAQEWRGWSNIHAFVMRHGVALDESTATQRERALDLVRATCSARAFAPRAT